MGKLCKNIRAKSTHTSSQAQVFLLSLKKNTTLFTLIMPTHTTQALSQSILYNSILQEKPCVVWKTERGGFSEITVADRPIF